MKLSVVVILTLFSLCAQAHTETSLIDHAQSKVSRCLPLYPVTTVFRGTNQEHRTSSEKIALETFLENGDFFAPAIHTLNSPGSDCVDIVYGFLVDKLPRFENQLGKAINQDIINASSTCLSKIPYTEILGHVGKSLDDPTIPNNIQRFLSTGRVSKALAPRLRPGQAKVCGNMVMGSALSIMWRGYPGADKEIIEIIKKMNLRRYQIQLR